MRFIVAAATVGVLAAVAGCSSGGGGARPAAAVSPRTAAARPTALPSVRTDTKCLAALPKVPDGVLFTDTRVIFLTTIRPAGAGAILTGSETHRVGGGDDDGHYDEVGPVRTYRVAPDATVVVLANAPRWHELCTDVRGLLALAPGSDDPRSDPSQQRTDGIYGWSTPLAAIKTDHAGTIIRIEERYTP